MPEPPAKTMWAIQARRVGGLGEWHAINVRAATPAQLEAMLRRRGIEPALQPLAR
ncbi:MAG: hypothetical protein AAGI17_03900 [Planctomycetota bacterium]